MTYHIYLNKDATFELPVLPYTLITSVNLSGTNFQRWIPTTNCIGQGIMISFKCDISFAGQKFIYCSMKCLLKNS